MSRTTPGPLPILSSYAAGTAYSLTNTATALAFGTTNPSITITRPGTWLIFGSVKLDYNGATFAAVRTVTLKLRRTNNTAADLANGVVTFLTNIITTLTYTAGTVSIPPIFYQTTNNNDVVTLFGDIGVVPTAGTLDASAASIIAVKIA